MGLNSMAVRQNFSTFLLAIELHVVPITLISLDGTLIQATETCRNLGVTFNDKFTMEKFVAQKCRSASFALHRIGRIRSFLINKRQNA